jgi:hypothetical protein
MPNGFTDPDAVHCGQQNSASTSTFLFAGSPPVEGFSGSGAPIWYVGRPTNYDTVTKGDVVGTISWGLNGGQGVIGWGGELFGTGVMGLGGVNWPVYGPLGDRCPNQVVGAGSSSAATAMPPSLFPIT